mmetsp:Transcript_43379/g.91116  ORF Transcript_43379/g.91116 Transcript_43379/m.91116 type:complete len:201 (-) Transcript_43379:320-922(-)
MVLPRQNQIMGVQGHALGRRSRIHQTRRGRLVSQRRQEARPDGMGQLPLRPRGRSANVPGAPPARVAGHDSRGGRQQRRGAQPSHVHECVLHGLQPVRGHQVRGAASSVPRDDRQSSRLGRRAGDPFEHHSGVHAHVAEVSGHALVRCDYRQAAVAFGVRGTDHGQELRGRGGNQRGEGENIGKSGRVFGMARWRLSALL